jgi:hypothetical protein
MTRENLTNLISIKDERLEFLLSTPYISRGNKPPIVGQEYDD